jgi:hypothetical protein
MEQRRMQKEIILHGQLYMLLHLSLTLHLMQVAEAEWVLVYLAAALAPVLAKWEK